MIPADEPILDDETRKTIDELESIEDFESFNYIDWLERNWAGEYIGIVCYYQMYFFQQFFAKMMRENFNGES